MRPSRLNSYLLALGLVLSLAIHAHAQEATTEGNFLVAPSLFYYSAVRTRSSKDTKSYLTYELQLAYQVHPNIFLGLAYQGEQNNTKTSGYASDSLNNTTKSQRTSLGPLVGYVTPTYHVLFTYFYDSKLDLKTTTSTGSNKYAYTGTGMQLDLGYKIPFWGILFGPQISYKMYTYNKLSTDGGAKTSISPKLEEANFDPSLVLYYFF